MHNTATFLILSTSGRQRNNLVRSLTHLMVVIIATVKAELVLWVALGDRPPLDFSIRRINIRTLLYQLYMVLLIKNVTCICD